MNIALFASGSSGNCALVSDGETHILIDAGISARRIRAGLTAQDVAMADLAGVLVTHEHSDHVKGLTVLELSELVHALEEGRPVELVSIAASDGSKM